VGGESTDGPRARREQDDANNGRQSGAGEGDLATDVERRARQLAERTARGAARLLARAREEVEDIWAEARDRAGRR
jgi:hypothetical protein